MRTLSKRLTLLAVASALAVSLAGCDSTTSAPTVRDAQSAAAATAANSLTFTQNAEIENIQRRLKLTANPGQIGFVLLMNEAGQPIMYTSVRGKITSGGKRLTRPDLREDDFEGDLVRQAPSDEGTYGSSDEYVFFWTMDGQYVQWNGKYLYSDKPFRISVQPLVINVTAAVPAPK